MSNHLSENEFARSAAGQSTAADLQHLMECGACRAELDRFGKIMLSFRSAVRDRIDVEVTGEAPFVLMRPLTAGMPKWRLALFAAAIVILVLVPFLTKENEPPVVIEKASTETDPNALMDAINLHLSRTVPAPMERMMAVIPNDESVIESGGVQ